MTLTLKSRGSGQWGDDQASLFADAEPKVAKPEPEAAKPAFRTGASTAPGAKSASQKQRDLLRTMIAEREGQDGIQAIRDRLNRAREGGYLTTAIFTETFEALKAIPRTPAPEGDKEISPVFVAPEVWPGIYTLDKGGDHRTFRVVLQPRDADFRPGETILGFLSGPDNEADYTDFAFIKGGRLRVWGRFKGNAELIADAEAFLADPDSMLKARHCLRCNALLTVTSSIELGMGPTCATKGW